jgi:hypothetical protein
MRGVLLLGLFTVVSAVIKGANFFGLETPSKNFDCSWAHDVEYYVDQLVSVGYNSLRVPFSVQYVEEGDYSRLDHLMNVVSKYKSVTILLDAHRVFSDHQAPDPYEGTGKLDRFVSAWKKIAGRYADNPQVTSLDIFNEYQGTDAGWWNSVLEQIVTQLEQAFPGRYNYLVGGTNWGGSLAGISLEHLPFSSRIFYTIHKYSFSNEEWESSFGSYPEKVIIGEWGGFFSSKADEAQWARSFVDWCVSKGIKDSYFWTAVCNSGDTGGLWTDCQNFDYEKQKYVQRLWDGKVGGGGVRGG